MKPKNEKSGNEKSGSVYFGIVSRRRPPKSKTPLKKWQHLTGISGSISSESVAGFEPDYPFTIQPPSIYVSVCFGGQIFAKPKQESITYAVRYHYSNTCICAYYISKSK